MSRFNIPTPQELRQARHDAGLSQYDLADRSGVSQTHIANVECARHNPRLQTLRKLTDVLNEELADQEND